MRIFVTGAGSLLGRAVCARLGAHTLLCLRHRAAVPGEAVPGALERPETYRDVARSADAVVHLAAETNARRRERYYRVNVEGTRALLSASRGHFVFVSTRTTGGAYADSKRRAEALVRASGLPWTILRPSEILGAREGVSRLMTMRFFPLPFWPTPPPLAPVELAAVADAIARCVGDPACHGKSYLLAGPSRTFSELRKRSGAMGFPLPLLPLHAAVAAGALPVVAPDQVARLLGPKETDVSAARRDLGFLGG